MKVKEILELFDYIDGIQIEYMNHIDYFNLTEEQQPLAAINKLYGEKNIRIISAGNFSPSDNTSDDIALIVCDTPEEVSK